MQDSKFKPKSIFNMPSWNPQCLAFQELIQEALNRLYQEKKLSVWHNFKAAEKQILKRLIAFEDFVFKSAGLRWEMLWCGINQAKLRRHISNQITAHITVKLLRISSPM